MDKSIYGVHNNKTERGFSHSLCLLNNRTTALLSPLLVSSETHYEILAIFVYVWSII
jgi:hypothetical protein